MPRYIPVLGLTFICLFARGAHGADLATRLDALEQALQSQARTIEEQQKTINALKEELERQRINMTQQPPAQTAPDRTARDEHAPDVRSGGFFGGNILTNPYISAIVNTYGYSSNLSTTQLQSQGISGFTTQGLPSQRGFNFESMELSIFAPVDPYFNLYTNIPITGSGAGVEEAYAVTTDLPEGFQVKLGKFKSNFSRLNAQHPHAWDFFDVALPYRAFLGTEGLGGDTGVQITWLPSWPVYTQFGLEAFQGQNDLLFGSRATSGPHAFTFFARNSFDTTDNSTLLFGPYVLFGKTQNSNIIADGPVTGNSVLAGLEAVWKWKPESTRGLTLQSEYLFLSQDGTVTTGPETGGYESLRRRQDGLYAQGIYQADRWRFGGRFGILDLFADTFKQAGVRQDYARPWQVTASAEFNPSEFTRIRLQYNHDRTGPGGSVNNALILQFLFGIGAHAAHAF